MLGKFFDSRLLLMSSVVMEALNKPNKSSFKSRADTVIVRYELSFIAKDDVLDKLSPIFMSDFLYI